MYQNGSSVFVSDSDPFAYSQVVAKLDGADVQSDEAGRRFISFGTDKFYDLTQLVESERQASKPLALKTAENNFFKLCFAIFQTMDKRGFSEISQTLEGMSSTDPQTAMVLSIKLLGIDAEAKREGGLQWWDDATWHPEIEQ
jgi:hypothetical protein